MLLMASMRDISLANRHESSSSTSLRQRHRPPSRSTPFVLAMGSVRRADVDAISRPVVHRRDSANDELVNQLLRYVRHNASRERASGASVVHMRCSSTTVLIEGARDDIHRIRWIWRIRSGQWRDFRTCSASLINVPESCLWLVLRVRQKCD